LPGAARSWQRGPAWESGPGFEQCAIRLGQAETRILSTEWAILFFVTAARLLVPLAVPRYPLPAIFTALLLDGVDQTLFQQFAPAVLEGYQAYDKALDIYYLTIAYVSTLRNWENRFALRHARVLFCWRLVGVALFEITGLRWLLLIFPNAFEYLFIFYEVVSLRWEPRRLGHRMLVAVAAIVWIVIKLPTRRRGTGVEGNSNTRTMGIWQTEWMEPVPATALPCPRLTPELALGPISLEQALDGNPERLAVRARLSDARGPIAGVVAHACRK